MARQTWRKACRHGREGNPAHPDVYISALADTADCPDGSALKVALRYGLQWRSRQWTLAHNLAEFEARRLGQPTHVRPALWDNASEGAARARLRQWRCDGRVIAIPAPSFRRRRPGGAAYVALAPNALLPWWAMISATMPHLARTPFFPPPPRAPSSRHPFGPYVSPIRDARRPFALGFRDRAAGQP